MFWIGPTTANRTVDIMVNPSKLQEFTEFINKNHLPYEIYISDVQELIRNENPPSIARVGFDFNSYHTLSTMHQHLEALEERYASNVKVFVAGTSYEKRQIKGANLRTMSISLSIKLICTLFLIIFQILFV